MNTLDTTLYNLRPKPMMTLTNGPPHWSSSVSPAVPPGPSGNQQWSPKMWRAIDKEMSLKECSIYCYSPEEDPYDVDEGTIWSFNYFFFNKARKRVCYIYLRGLSIISNSPVLTTLMSEERSLSDDWRKSSDLGARKRAKYWLGDRVNVEGGWDEDDEDDRDFVTWDDETESRLLPEGLERTYTRQPEEEGASPDSSRSRSYRSRSKSTVRGTSEEVAGAMEI